MGWPWALWFLYPHTWPIEQQGGRAPEKNALGLDFRQQLPPMACTLTTQMHNSDHRPRR
ncbi:MAG: hypothetical protein ACREV3_06820 [Gammaproteobacteria bacterium]